MNNGKPPGRPRRPDAIPAGVKEGIIQELAAQPVGERGKIELVAARYDVTEAAVKQIGQRNKMDIQERRQRLAERAGAIADRNLDRLEEALENDEKMAETPLRDMAMSFEKVANSMVTLQEGHTPQVQINFGQIKEHRRMLESFESYTQEKLAKAREVTPQA